MNFLSVIYHHNTKLQTFLDYVQFKMECKNRKVTFEHIWRAITSQHLVFMQNVSQSYGSLFFLLYRTGNRIEKCCFFQEFWLFENSIQVFNFCTKILTSAKLWRTGNFQAYFFSKALMVHYHCTRFAVSRISLSRDMGREQKRPPRAYTNPWLYQG